VAIATFVTTDNPLLVCTFTRCKFTCILLELVCLY